MRCAHEYDAFGAIQYALKMRFQVISRVENGFLADKAAQAVSHENKGTGGRIATSSVRRQIVQKVRSVIDQPI